MRASPDLNDYDLKKWRPALREYAELLSKKETSIFRDSQKSNVVLKKWKSRELYALITGIVSIKPNGLMTRAIIGKPMNNLWWWDFLITDGTTLLSVMCSNSKVEIFCHSNAKGFDIDEFLQFNMSKYNHLVKAQLETFEIHDAYINHYQSYRSVTKYLYQEIKELDLRKPAALDRVTKSVKSERFSSEVQRYSHNSVKFHALGKSLVLNSAFMAESYLNLLVRIGSNAPESELKQFSRNNFEYRIKNLYLYCNGVTWRIDTTVEPIKDMLGVMTLRNKYAHTDLSSGLNMLEPAYFDGDYPLIDSINENFIVDSIESAFHKPDLKTVLDSYKVADRFINYLKSLIIQERKEEFEAILNLRVITRNRHTRRYSMIHHHEAQIIIPSSD